MNSSNIKLVEKREKGEVKKWHVIYTKSKWEKKVDELLMQNGFESWCPVKMEERRWTDRKKIIYTPLFRSYVFVKASKEDHTKILSINGVVNFLYFEKKPAIIRDAEIQEIRKYLGLSTETLIHIIDMSNLAPQTKVSINQGLFMGRRGEIIKANKNTVFVRIESLKMMMIVEFKVNDVTPV
jgi:transcription antitermination factor NusG